MKRTYIVIALALLFWLGCFAAITWFSFEQGEIGYSGGECWMGWGYPNWLIVGSIGGGLRKLQANLRNGDWYIDYGSLWSAASIALMPVVFFALAWIVKKRTVRFHLLTFVLLILAAGSLLLLNTGAWSAHAAAVARLERGWPMRVEYYSRAEQLIGDGAVDLVILFALALALEWRWLLHSEHQDISDPK